MNRNQEPRERALSRHRRISAGAVVFVLGWVPAAAAEETRRGPFRLVRETALADPAPGTIGIDVDRAAYRGLWESGGGIVQDFPLPGLHPVELELEAFELLAPGARLIAADGSGERTIPRPAIRFFRGSVAGDVTSLVSLSLFDGRISGFVRTLGEEYGVGPRAFGVSAAGAHELRVWARRVAETESRVCEGALVPAGDERPRPVVRPQGIDRTTGLVAQVAVDATFDWYAHFGADLVAAQNYILALMGQVSTIYNAELLVQLEVPFLRVFTAEPDPYTNGSTSTSVLLSELQAEWNANQQDVFRTVVHLFSVRPSGGAGLAYIDVLCDGVLDPGNSSDYGVSSISATGGSFEKELVAHELGHNFSSPHTNCYVPPVDMCFVETGCYPGPPIQTVGTIMSRCDDTVPEFHPRTEDEYIRPAAEAAFPTCIDIAGLPGDLREETGDGLRLSKPASCPTATLKSDDGTLNTSFGATGSAQLAWVKRLAPACYPFRLERVDMITAHSSVAPGRDIRLLVYVEPSGRGSVADATLVYQQDVEVEVVSSSVWNEYALDSPVILDSGEFYLGFYDLVADPTTNFIAAADTSTSGDSFYGFGTSPDGYQPYNPGTWMIRGQGGPVPTGSVRLDWGTPCNDTEVPAQDFAVYRGTVGAFTDYASLTCSTARQQTYLATATPGSTFFLVVPTTTAVEGSYGQTSRGAERPPAAVPCKPQDPAVCP